MPCSHAYQDCVLPFPKDLIVEIFLSQAIQQLPGPHKNWQRDTKMECTRCRKWEVEVGKIYASGKSSATVQGPRSRIDRFLLAFSCGLSILAFFASRSKYYSLFC